MLAIARFKTVKRETRFCHARITADIATSQERTDAYNICDPTAYRLYQRPCEDGQACFIAALTVVDILVVYIVFYDLLIDPCDDLERMMLLKYYI